MSVINQMLRDLDARGHGDAAARRAAMAAVGHVAGGRALSGRGGGRWWRWAAVTLALALAGAVVVLVMDRGHAVDATPARPKPSSAAPTPVSAPAAPAAPAGPVPAEPATSAPAPNRVAAAPATPAPDAAGAPEPSAAAPAVRSPSNAVPRDERDPRPEPAVAAAPKATIERVANDVDPLAAAREALAAGRPDAALAILSNQPASTAERDALEAAAQQQLGRHDAAEQAYRRALRREPDIGAWWAGLGISLDASGRGAEALEAFREAQRRGPLDPALADYLGERVDALSAGEPSR